MPFLASENTPKKTLVEAARAIIDRQETETWKWYDADLLAFLQDGIAALERLRPASGYVGMRRVPRTPVDIPVVPDVNHDPYGSDSDSDGSEWEEYVERMNVLLAEPVLVDGRWHQALVEYICYEAFRRDESDAASQKLAQQHYQSFVELSQR
jgi:hypothetical protein